MECMFCFIIVWVLTAGATTIGEAFPIPDGFIRTEDSAFGKWARQRVVEDPTEPIRTYAGDRVAHHGRVVRLPLVPGDRQQCADSLIRLRAEWERSLGISPVFHATSGDPMGWQRYQDGEIPYEKNGRIAWKTGKPGSFEQYLARVFIWAGTASLHAYDTKPVTSPRSGDMLIQPGYPGHAVLLLDVVSRGSERLVLIGEGYMPAQNFHVELGPVGGWWRWNEGVALDHWNLPAETLRRFVPASQRTR